MKHAIPLALSLLALVSCRAGLGSGPLDGNVFAVELAGPPGQPAQADYLVFDGGLFESTACRSYGFRSAAYSAADEGGAARFEASPVSSKSGATTWTGTIRGDAIEGSMQWTDDKGAVSDFRFAGKRASGLLDGQSFAGQICEGSETSGDPDTLVFAGGSFDSLACRAYGFTKSPYAATRDGDLVRFSADAVNAAGETNRWEGTLRGGAIEGSMKHVSASGRVLDSYRFVAKLAP